MQLSQKNPMSAFAIALLLALCIDPAFATTCASKSLQPSDRHALQEMSKALEEPAPNLSKNNPTARELRTQSLYWNEVSKKIESASRTSVQPDLRRVLATLTSIFAETSEMFAVGAVLTRANEDLKLSIINTALDAIRTEDARRLLQPVGSLVELKFRMEDYKSWSETFSQGTPVRLDEALRRFYAVVNLKC